MDLLGTFNPAEHKGFSRVSSAYCDRDLYLRKEVNKAFVTMAKAARKDGIDLRIISATRNFTRQTEIWEGKWENFKGSDFEKAEEILLYSSMPGTSRHHWGTDFDLNSLEPEYFESGRGAQIYKWLNTNAWRYGFFQPYYEKGEERIAGYKEEKWHWSYYPTANRLLKAYNNLIDYKDIEGFQGATLADSLDVFKNYVNAIYVPKDLEYKVIRNRYLN
jgi:LAS superfamily LD-carboxypeptidase LdcB